jgi:hypothetical protein
MATDSRDTVEPWRTMNDDTREMSADGKRCQCRRCWTMRMSLKFLLMRYDNDCWGLPLPKVLKNMTNHLFLV